MCENMKSERLAEYNPPSLNHNDQTRISSGINNVKQHVVTEPKKNRNTLNTSTKNNQALTMGDNNKQ